jgi:hypothetical protein
VQQANKWAQFHSIPINKNHIRKEASKRAIIKRTRNTMKRIRTKEVKGIGVKGRMTYRMRENGGGEKEDVRYVTMDTKGARKANRKEEEKTFETRTEMRSRWGSGQSSAKWDHRTSQFHLKSHDELPRTILQLLQNSNRQ